MATENNEVYATLLKHLDPGYGGTVGDLASTTGLSKGMVRAALQRLEAGGRVRVNTATRPPRYSRVSQEKRAQLAETEVRRAQVSSVFDAAGFTQRQAERAIRTPDSGGEDEVCMRIVDFLKLAKRLMASSRRRTRPQR
jgi:predicted ArsR family transcriptional regulator